MGATASCCAARVRRQARSRPSARRRKSVEQPAAFPAAAAAAEKAAADPANAPMLVQATEIRYDYTNNTVAAVGNVQIYYGGATIEADEVIYDQKTKRLRAQGNVRLTEPDGKITYGQIIDLTDDYRDGFVDSLRLETARRHPLCRGARRSQPRAITRSCKTASTPPANPARTIRRNRRSGRFRRPGSSTTRARRCSTSRMLASSSSACRSPMCRSCRRPIRPSSARADFCFRRCRTRSQYGFGIETPYFWALAPNYDLTLRHDADDASKVRWSKANGGNVC